MSLFLDSPAAIAGAATIFGGAGLKLVEWWLSRQTRENTDAQQLRQELRTQVLDLKGEASGLKGEIDKTEEEITVWRNRYYDLRDEYVTKSTELTIAVERIKEFQTKIDTIIEPTIPLDKNGKS